MAGRPDAQIRAAFHGRAGTVERHRSGWKRWLAYCKELQLHPGRCGAAELADFCSMLCMEDDDDLEPDEDVAADWAAGQAAVRTSFAAISFVAQRARILELQEALRDPSVSGYRKEIPAAM